MFDKIKNHFKEAELECSTCGKVIGAGENITVSLLLPERNNMPVGQLDKVLAAHNNKILCSQCSTLH